MSFNNRTKSGRLLRNSTHGSRQSGPPVNDYRSLSASTHRKTHVDSLGLSIVTSGDSTPNDTAVSSTLSLTKSDKNSDSDAPIVVHTPASPSSTVKPPRTFIPPNSADQPAQLFISSNSPFGSRFVRRTNPQEMLIYTEGACSWNGTPWARAGSAVLFMPTGTQTNLSLRLENTGPDQRLYPQTSNRAELRAVIAALQLRAWGGEGFSRVVIASDSAYVVLGITQWVRKWTQNGWRTSRKKAVKNQDLWNLLLKIVQEMEAEGVQPMFWRIPHEWNKPAHALARKAARTKPDVPTFRSIYGLVI